jgi:hypothetical protein
MFEHEERELIAKLINVLEATVAALDDLNAAVAANTTAVNAAVAELNANAGDSVPAADVETAAQTIAANTASLTAATTPPVAPAS